MRIFRLGCASDSKHGQAPGAGRPRTRAGRTIEQPAGVGSGGPGDIAAK